MESAPEKNSETILDDDDDQVKSYKDESFMESVSEKKDEIILNDDDNQTQSYKDESFMESASKKNGETILNDDHQVQSYKDESLMESASEKNGETILNDDHQVQSYKDESLMESASKKNGETNTLNDDDNQIQSYNDKSLKMESASEKNGETILNDDHQVQSYKDESLMELASEKNGETILINDNDHQVQSYNDESFTKLEASLLDQNLKFHLEYKRLFESHFQELLICIQENNNLNSKEIDNSYKTSLTKLTADAEAQNQKHQICIKSKDDQIKQLLLLLEEKDKIINKIEEEKRLIAFTLDVQNQRYQLHLDECNLSESIKKNIEEIKLEYNVKENSVVMLDKQNTEQHRKLLAIEKQMKEIQLQNMEIIQKGKDQTSFLDSVQATIQKELETDKPTMVPYAKRNGLIAHVLYFQKRILYLRFKQMEGCPTCIKDVDNFMQQLERFRKDNDFYIRRHNFEQNFQQISDD